MVIQPHEVCLIIEAYEYLAEQPEGLHKEEAALLDRLIAYRDSEDN